MLLLYYTNTIIFLLSLSKPNSNSPFTKYLNKNDIQYLPQEVCIAQCLGNVSHPKSSNINAMPSHMEVIAEFNKNTTLEHCVGHCAEHKTNNQNTAPIKKIHENYSLNLICRDENSLNFLINLHATNLQENRSKYLGETNNVPSTSTPPSASTLSSSASTMTSVSANNAAAIADDDADVVLFVIKIHLANETDIYKVYLSDDKFFTLEQLFPNTTYNITAFAVHSQNKYSVIALGEQFQTLRRSYTPGNITNIKVVDFREDLANPTHLSATVLWKPPPDMTCFYDIICFSPISNDFEMQPVEIRNPRKLYKYQLDNMTFSTEYKVGIRAKNIKNMKESDLFWKTFYAPSCAEWHNYNFNICAPDAPGNLQYQLYYASQHLYSLNVSWNRPNHYPDNYTLSIKDMSPLGQGYYFNISKDVNNFFIEDIEIRSPYFHVLLTASTMGGNATSLAVKTADAVIQFPEKNHFVKLFVVILAPICCFAILSLTLFMIFHRRAKLKRYQERCKYFEELEKKAPIDPKDNFDFVNSINNSKQGATMDLHISMENEDTTALFNDDMEIDRSQLTLYEVLGEGAFGLVKRGIYKDNKCNGGIVHEVAVKMLKDHPTADDVRAFRREIEVMKSVEKHPNIVGILGHCTRLSNEMMLLTEYCSFGNLLDFLRDEWRFLHDIQQKRQKHTSIIVDVELPHVPARHGSTVHELTGSEQRTSHKTTKFSTSPPNSPAPPIPQCCKSYAISVASGENINNRVEELENFKNKTQSKQTSIMGKHNGERFNSDSDEFIIEQFKRKYNDFGKQECDSEPKEQLSDMTNKIYPTLWVNNVTRFKDIRGSMSCKDINISSTITSPAAENKSYGYDGCCTNACKCNVDVIIRNIDSSDSSREQEELDRLLLNQQNTSQTPPNQVCATTIAIKNCDCRKPKSLSTCPLPPPPPPPPPPPTAPVRAVIPGKNAVDNKSYFKFFRGSSNKAQTHHRHHSAIGSSSTTNTTESTNTENDENGENDDEHGDNWPQRVPLKSGDLLDIARQVAVGMDFLAKNKVVHRDLAARNVLVAPDRTIKIADFGLSRDVYQENIYKKTGNGKLPIKWLALESLTHQVYTTQSDVWSYGILLYEIVTLGATPYPSIPTNRLLHLLKTGYRMEKPKNCGDEFYALMYSCWNAVPNERPTFVDIQKNLDVMLNKSDKATSTPSAGIKGRMRPTLKVQIPQNQVCCQDKKTIDCPDFDSGNEIDVGKEKRNNENGEEIYAEKQKSPVLQICPDDSYLSPL